MIGDDMEQKHRSIAIAIESLNRLLCEKKILTDDEIMESFSNMLVAAEEPCEHKDGFDLNGVGMWICKTCRADITPEQNELSFKDQDASRVMIGDSEFDSLAAHGFLLHLITVLDKYGHGSSMMHPRLTIAIYNAKQFLKHNPTP
jgi:hypothetical protein